MTYMNVAPETVEVTRAEAADWIVRGALPRFLDLLTLSVDAAYFSGLEPFRGYTPTGRVRGWQGAGVRLAAAEETVSAAHARLIAVNPHHVRDAPTGAEVEARRACVFARTVMLPSRLGWTAYRVIGRASRLAKHAAQMTDDGRALVDEAWEDAFRAITDRAVLRAHLAVDDSDQ